MKIIRTLAAVVLLTMASFNSHAQFWAVDNLHWTASGIQSNYHNLTYAACGNTNWTSIWSPNGPVILDNLNMVGTTPPYTFRMFRTIGSAMVLTTNLISTNHLVVDVTNSTWANKWAILHRSDPTNGLFMRLWVTNGGGVTNYVPWGRKSIGFDTKSDSGSGAPFTNWPPRGGDKLFILEKQGEFTLTVTNVLTGVNAGAGTPGTDVPLGIAAGNGSMGEQMVVFEMSASATAGAVSAVNTNEIKLLRGRYLR